MWFHSASVAVLVEYFPCGFLDGTLDDWKEGLRWPLVRATIVPLAQVGTTMTLKSYVTNTAKGMTVGSPWLNTSTSRDWISGTDRIAKDSRHVYLAACTAIADAFTDEGFSFSKTGPHMTAKSEDKRFVFRVGFQPGLHTIPGQHIQLLAHVSIESPLVKKRKKALWASYDEVYEENGSIALTHLGYLAPLRDRDWLEWDLDREPVRGKSIADVIGRIRTDALPWFGYCEDVPRLIETIMDTGSYPLLDVFPADFLLSFAAREQIEQALCSYIDGLSRQDRGILYKEVEAARVESPKRINVRSFPGCDVRELLAGGIAFPPRRLFR